MIDGKPFEQFKVYPQIKKHIAATIDILLKNKDTFGKDLEILMAKKHTFRAAINSSMPVMVRQRLSIFWNEISAAMKNALVFGKTRISVMVIIKNVSSGFDAIILLI
ncbi:hypothetical protein LJB99_03225 [Deltaproteobacteria bacterium OttesenSCG-928-K17]|nr:hypothetical protein [Deltaproteobacteria bacterium OttesenSCG-928-K17]